METVGEEDEGHSDDVVEDEFFKVTTGFFELEEEDEGLLCPEARLRR